MRRVSSAMHIETIRRRQGDKVYTYHLLRQTYREGGKVKHRTLANLSHLPEAVLELVRRALRGEPVAPVPQTVKIRQSRQHGAVAAVVGTIRQLGLDQVLYSRSADWVRLALAVVVMRILRPSSKLGGTLWWTTTTLPQLLRLPHNGEDVNDVYRAMDELLARQAAIEAKLARRHLTPNAMVLYDLTSVYLEGKTCPLARFGYNRDKKRGKKQFCVGLLTNDEGCPVAVEVFPGDVGDPETLRAQIARVRARFGIEYVVFVGDRGMIVKARLSDLEAVGFGWITALRAPEIQKLRDEGFFQPGLFDRRDLAEIADPERPGERLVVCYNPLVAEERRQKREALLLATERELAKIEARVRRRRRKPLTADEIGVAVGKVLRRWKVGKHFQLEIRDGHFAFRRKEASIAREAELDGFYVLRTNVPADRMEPAKVQATYKSLRALEQNFRTMKSALDLRPVYHRLEDRVRAHAFLCMLALYVRWHMERALEPLLAEDPRQSFEGLMMQLETLQRHTVEVAGQEIQMLGEPEPLHQRIFQLLGVPLA
ncbi:IS1634 family transposase [Geochorda subterranea]|uniref:IS1634 family transposase n=1 Tax=Geochorda subterranea TaxID=3109564 RepID=A0ABZ1BMS3_9FIRM|nr:IS1634 family transposase [Limnochorda sp. LNt]WRP13798.1 IS1634 family transposase [Limnochorda sp. LNt]